MMRKKLFTLLVLLYLPISMVWGQQELPGFEEIITIDGVDYFSGPAVYGDYSYIILKDQFGSALIPKTPAWGLVDENNRIVIPCKYAALLIDNERGCIFAMSCNKAMLNAKYGAFDFSGKEVLPFKYKSSLKNIYVPHKNARDAFDALDSAIKEECLAVYNNIVRGEEPKMLAQKTEVKPESSLRQQPIQKQVVENPYKISEVGGEMFATTLSDVDQNIPVTGKSAENTFVLIFANENYTFVDDVEFALNDGRIFKEYCIKTLGIPEKQVWLYENASYGIFNAGITKMVQAMNFFDNPNAIVYYCGHGIPDEKTNEAYIVPTDGNGKNTATCYSLNTLYKTLAATNAAQVTYFMDACFTGASKSGSMLVAARGIAIEPKQEKLSGKTVVFSATSSDETAMPYKEKQHGLFTYYLLKKLQESKGEVTYDELSQYLNKNVKKESFLTNEKPQTPVVATSPAVQNTWKSMKLK